MFLAISVLVQFKLWRFPVLGSRLRRPWSLNKRCSTVSQIRLNFRTIVFVYLSEIFFPFHLPLVGRANLHVPRRSTPISCVPCKQSGDRDRRPEVSTRRWTVWNEGKLTTHPFTLRVHSPWECFFPTPPFFRMGKWLVKRMKTEKTKSGGPQTLII